MQSEFAYNLQSYQISGELIFKSYLGRYYFFNNEKLKKHEDNKMIELKKYVDFLKENIIKLK